jgi:preprotein translocase subunit SecG
MSAVVIHVLTVIHLMIALALIGVVLLQRSEGGGLGIGSSGGMGSFMTARGTGNLLTRTTVILAVLFLLTSIVLAKFSIPTGEPRSIIDTLAPVTGPATTPAPGTPAAPATPAPSGGAPSVPR